MQRAVTPSAYHSGMRPFRFFMSYAWKNRGAPLTRFFDALATHVRDRVGGELDAVAFRDRVTMKAGEEWSDGLFQALRTSQSLVYLLSIDYVQSDFCGQEFHAFLSRIEAFKRANPGVKPPLFIHPVLWVPPAAASLPEVIARVQPEDDGYPPEYAKYGLESLAKQRSRATFNECVKVLGDRIVATVTEDRLPPLTGYDKLQDIPNAFTAGPRQKTSVGGGPTEVRCVYVAASADELRTQPEGSRGNLQCYGSDGWYWQPFNPPVPTTVGSVVQQMLAEYRYRRSRSPKTSTA